MTEQNHISLSPEQLQQIVADAVAKATGNAGASTAKPANRKQRRKAARTSTSKASYEHSTANTASTAPAKYGRAVVGFNASDTHSKRVAQLEAAAPGISKLAQISSQGKIPGKGLERNLKVCDRASVGVWTYVQLPGGSKAEADKLAKKATGLSMDAVSKALKASGYGWYSRGQCWRTRCDGTPALGGRRLGRQDAWRNALDVDDN